LFLKGRNYWLSLIVDLKTTIFYPGYYNIF
jgi:hypothetical protein